MQALILAAGYGTRLYPLVKNTAKALLEINGKTLVDHILDRLGVLNDLNEVIVVTNDKFYADFQNWADRKEGKDGSIHIVNDMTLSNDDRLGSIGDMDFVIKKGLVKEDLLVVGGDNLFDFNIEEYIHFAQEKTESVTIGVYDIGDIEQAHEFGVVEVNDNHKIISFEEKPDHPKTSLIAMCFYYLPQKTHGFLTKYLVESKKSDKAGDYIRWLHEEGEVYGFKFSGKWFDIGSVDSLKEAQENFK